MIQTVFFDADGVLIKLVYFTDVLKERGYDVDKFLPLFSNEFQKCLIGKADLKKEVLPYLDKIGWDKDVDAFLKDWFDSENFPQEDMLSYVDQLRSNSIRCYITTNQEKHRAQYIWEDMEFKNHFDDIYASSRVGYRKPDTEYFQAVLKATNSTPQETFFVDDSEINVQGAKTVGIQAALFKDVDQLKSILNL